MILLYASFVPLFVYHIVRIPNLPSTARITSSAKHLILNQPVKFLAKSIDSRIIIRQETTRRSSFSLFYENIAQQVSIIQRCGRFREECNLSKLKS